MDKVQQILVAAFKAWLGAYIIYLTLVFICYRTNIFFLAIYLFPVWWLKKGILELSDKPLKIFWVFPIDKGKLDEY